MGAFNNHPGSRGDLSRRGFLKLGGVAGLAVAVTGGCTYRAMSRRRRLPTAVPSPAAPSPEPITANLGRGVRVHMFQTGWVAVKKPHRAFSGPSALRTAAIVMSGAWTEWLPITAFVIEHPEGLYVFDTGETARISEPEYPACDPVTGWFYRRNLQFALGPEDEIGPQMRRAGLEPESVRRVLMSHLHSDHVGGMQHFKGAEFLVSEAARGGHAGALMCRLPSGLRAAPLEQTPIGAFQESFRVTEDGAITLVPTPGHAAGHQSVLIQVEGKSLCLAGDAAFSLDQILTGKTPGIVENVRDARSSARALRRQHLDFGTVLLPTHDPANAGRLRKL
ncbi:MAG: N-acyl homoserine lactonase family protein [Acidobacteriota bacterium]